MSRRMPQFQLCDIVSFELEVENKQIGYKTPIRVEGEVCGVSFDPMCGGGPHYQYKVKVRWAEDSSYVMEHKLTKVEVKCER
jgi:hypothetical protein